MIIRSYKFLKNISPFLSISSLIFINLGFGITGTVIGFLIASFFINSSVFLYAAGHFIKSKAGSLLYLCRSYLPFLYISLIVAFNETVISSSTGIVPDIKKLIIKAMVLLIFSLPLLMIANKKVRIIK